METKPLSTSSHVSSYLTACSGTMRHIHTQTGITDIVTVPQRELQVQIRFICFFLCSFVPNLFLHISVHLHHPPCTPKTKVCVGVPILTHLFACKSFMWFQSHWSHFNSLCGCSIIQKYKPMLVLSSEKYVCVWMCSPEHVCAFLCVWVSACVLLYLSVGVVWFNYRGEQGLDGWL